MAKAIVYRQEFFDREYSAKEAYARLWGFAKKYRFRLVMGVLCGMLTAGTLVPMFAMIQPALAKVERRESAAVTAPVICTSEAVAKRSLECCEDADGTVPMVKTLESSDMNS